MVQQRRFDDVLIALREVLGQEILTCLIANDDKLVYFFDKSPFVQVHTKHREYRPEELSSATFGANCKIVQAGEDLVYRDQLWFSLALSENSDDVFLKADVDAYGDSRMISLIEKDFCIKIRLKRKPFVPGFA